MRVIILSLLITFSLITNNKSYCQSYTTHSKSCGACGKSVSSNSTVGMRCPHCGAKWGRQNTKTSSSTRYSNTDYNYPDTDYGYSKSSGITNSKVNLRESPSSSSSIKAIIPSYTSLSIISRIGSWYYVKYSFYNGYSFEETQGYVYKSLVD
jgi:rRNA maturation protein Nop10